MKMKTKLMMQQKITGTITIDAWLGLSKKVKRKYKNHKNNKFVGALGRKVVDIR